MLVYLLLRLMLCFFWTLLWFMPFTNKIMQTQVNEATLCFVVISGVQLLLESIRRFMPRRSGESVELPTMNGALLIDAVAR
jgi:uncharacterized membrane protein